MMNRFRMLLLFVLGIISLTISAQRDEQFKYMRGSLCMMMVEHPQLEFNTEIESVFEKMDIPNRFNGHDLGVRVFSFANDERQLRNIEIFGQEKQIAKKLVSKWFGRNKKTGGFNVDLVRERGLNAATKIDVKEAQRSARGMALLEDMGENLIGHTYWVVNDIKYVNQSNFASNVKNGLVIIGALVGQAQDQNKGRERDEDDPDALGNKTSRALSFMDKIKGFRVKITSYLFKLEWPQDVADYFYANYYTETPETEPDKVEAFVKDDKLFTMKYIGEYTASSAETTMSETMTKEDMIRKVCVRALDKNIAELQHKFADFRIKAPLVSTSPLKAYIGMKEDVTEKLRYEVLEVVEEEDGRHSYKRVGIIRPIAGAIWDNRFMAEEEGSQESKLDGTLFEKVSGDEFYPGMLIRELK